MKQQKCSEARISAIWLSLATAIFLSAGLSAAQSGSTPEWRQKVVDSAQVKTPSGALTNGSIGSSAQQAGSSNIELISGTQNLGSYKSLTEAQASEESINRQVLAGRRRPLVITLEGGEGVSQLKALDEWYRAVLRGMPERRDVVIVVHARNGNEVARYLLKGAVPDKLASSAIAPGKAQALTYSVTLSYEELARQK